MKFLFFFLSGFFSFFLLSSSTHASCTPRTYTECETGNATYCLTHGVSKGNRAQVMLHSDCTYSCVNLGPCNPTPTPTNTPPPGVTPTDTPTPPPGSTPSATPTQTPGDSATPTPVPSSDTTPTPTLGPTTGSLSLHFEGIDQNNNPNPNNRQRKIVVSFYKSNTFTQAADVSMNILVTSITGDQNGAFTNPSFDISSLPAGSYYVLVKSPEGSLREVLHNSQLITIIPGQLNQLHGEENTQPAILRMGDLDNSNTVDLQDYNILVDCYGKKETASSCTSHNASDTTKGQFADLNDDGTVDGIDYNILIRNFQQTGF